jgi:hypothetical protein
MSPFCGFQYFVSGHKITACYMIKIIVSGILSLGLLDGQAQVDRPVSDRKNHFSFALSDGEF